jgi:hypothetical protein
MVDFYLLSVVAEIIFATIREHVIMAILQLRNELSLMDDWLAKFGATQLVILK